MNLKLNNNLDSSNIFKIIINPKITFKKEGDELSYNDSFYLLNVKLKSTISLKDSY